MVMDGHVDENIDFDLNEAVIAVEVSTITEAAAREAYPNAEYLYVNSAPDGFLAVQSGKAYDPLAQGDELPLKLGRTAVTDSQFTYEDGENLLVLTL